jgi:hypothetical protein
MIRALLRALLAVIVAWFTVAPMAAVAVPSVPPTVYGYDAHASSASGDCTAERGPPASYGHAITTYNAVDLRSNGFSARPDGATPVAAFAYDRPALLVQVIRASGMTEGQVRVLDGDLSPLSWSRVAAKAGDEAFHYTSSKWLDGIMSGGLRKGAYATPDGSLSPLQATLDLALPPNRALPIATLRIDLAGLRKAGYEIPSPTRVSSTVTGPGGRVYNMPGGGYEMQFPYEIPPQFLSVVPR